MLRAVPGCRQMSPARSSASTIWWTEGGLTRKYCCMREVALAKDNHATTGRTMMNGTRIVATMMLLASFFWPTADAIGEAGKELIGSWTLVSVIVDQAGKKIAFL